MIPVEAANIGETLVGARSLAEYSAMFSLTDHDLQSRILDCPGGAASFTAEALGRGVDVTSVDPAYAGGPTALTALADHARDEARRGHQHLLKTADQCRWTFFADPADHLRRRLAAVDAFAADVVAHPHRYVPGVLPHLPFADDMFELVLCSHLLFTYDDRFDQAWHLAALLEMARVASGEVKVFPLLSHVDGARTSFLDDLRGALEVRGITSRVQAVGDELQRGGDEMLVLDGAAR